MKEVILKTNIKREKGFLYFTATHEDGNITLCRVPVAQRLGKTYPKKKKKEVK